MINALEAIAASLGTIAAVIAAIASIKSAFSSAKTEKVAKRAESEIVRLHSTLTNALQVKNELNVTIGNSSGFPEAKFGDTTSHAVTSPLQALQPNDEQSE